MRRLLGCTLLLAIVVTGCGSGSKAAVEASFQVASLHGKQVAVILPAGKLEVTLGTPTTHVAATKAAGGGGDHDAPSGWTYVPVGAMLDVNGVDTATLTSGAVKQVRLALTDGDTSYAVPSPYTVTDTGHSVRNSGRVTYVPVNGDGKDIGVAVTYDGLTQTVSADGKRDSGAAAPYYDGSVGEGSKVSVAGVWDSPKGTTVRMGGTVEIMTSPYLPTFGWAKPGHTFFAFDVTVGEVSARRGHGAPRLADLSLGARLDGTPALPSPPGVGPVARSSGGMVVRRIYFDVPTAKTHHLDLTAKASGIVATDRVVIR